MTLTYVFQVKVMKRSIKGFTLVELMITLAVLAILVTIGYPLYTGILEKGRRVDARGTLAKLAFAQERHYAMFGNYATSVDELNFGPDATEDGTNDTYAYVQAVSDIDYDRDGTPDNYTIALATDGDAATQDFVFTATARSSQLGDTDCRTFTIDQAGVKAALDSSSNDNTDSCW